jgi:CheY-like chemotaxis protein
VTLDERYAEAHAGVIPGDYVMLSVSDTGVGMTDEVKAHIFEAFFTTKPEGKGTGLGLATCQTIVQQLGGHIGVYSEFGEGSTFKVYFPRRDDSVEIPGNADRSEVLPRGNELLLVVEDEPTLRHLTCAVLEAQGYKVLRANNGQEGLRVVRELQQPSIQLVITDLIMPLMGGKAMADEMKAIYADLPILFTSGYSEDAISSHGVFEPGVEFLPKPYTPGALAHKVREVLDDKKASRRSFKILSG